MIKIRNKKVIKDIAVIMYKANGKKNFFIVFSIAMTTFMITVILTIAMSYRDTVFMRAARMNGMSYDLVLTEPETKQVEQVRAMEKVKSAGVLVKCAVGEKYNGRTLNELPFFWLDETAWEKQCIPALEYYKGRYPREANEIMLSVNALREMGISEPQPGMKLPLTWYSISGGLAGESVEKEFVLCGFFKDYAGWERGFVAESFYRDTGAGQTDFMQGKLMISLKNPLFSKKEIKEVEKTASILPGQVVEGDIDTREGFVRIIIVLAGIFFMTLVSGYLFIYNILLISVSKDIVCYGQMKTIGMTTVQVRGIVNRQVIWNCAMGIPIGFLFGIMVIRGIVPVVLAAVNPVLKSEEVVSLRPWIGLMAVLCSFFAYWTGSRKPVRLTGECSAIETMRYTGSVNRGIKRSRKVSLWSLAWNNLFRSKKQAVIILFSLVISTSMVWVTQTIVQQNDTERVLNTIYPYDIRLVNETILDDTVTDLLTEDKIQKIRELQGIKNVGTVMSADVVIPCQENVFGEYYKKLCQSRYMPGGNYEEDMAEYRKNPEESPFTSRIIGIDPVVFEKLNKSLGGTLDRKKFEEGKTGVVINSFGIDMGEAVGKQLIFWIPGDSGEQEKRTIQIADTGISEELPAYFSRGYSPHIIVSQSCLKELLDKSVIELIEISYEIPFSQHVEEQVKSIVKDEMRVSFDSKQERYNDMKKNSYRIMVLGNSWGLIVVLLAFLNYVNTIAASVKGRIREFVILESIGMTTRQLRIMLAMEGGCYAVLSLLGGIAMGLPASRLVFTNLNVYNMDYLLPWREIVMPYAIIVLLCIVIPVLLYLRESRTGTGIGKT